jgi:serine/threonine protein phosphatase PrpC
VDEDVAGGQPARRVEAAALTHRGAVRARNEDCVAIGKWIAQEDMVHARAFAAALSAPFVCIVADGMGGHPAGEVASRLATETLASLLPGAADGEIGSVLRQVNTQFYAVMERFPQYAGMGTVVSGLVARPDAVAIFNVGDSRAYRYHDGALVQLTVDDSDAPRWNAGTFFPRSGMVTQAIGGCREFADIDPHLHFEPCVPGTTYLLCSDGLYDALGEDEIAARIGADLAPSVEALLAAAIEAGARDNVSVALVRIADAGAEEAR